MALGPKTFFMVFPMHVGVFLAQTSQSGTTPQSSPCTWGCFWLKTILPAAHSVFPMHVGVFLDKVCGAWGESGLPHARGGVSKVVSTKR